MTNVWNDGHSNQSGLIITYCVCVVKCHTALHKYTQLLCVNLKNKKKSVYTIYEVPVCGSYFQFVTSLYFYKWNVKELHEKWNNKNEDIENPNSIFFIRYTRHIIIKLLLKSIKCLFSISVPGYELLFLVHLTASVPAIIFFVLFYYSYVHTRLRSFLPLAPTPSLTTHSAPSLSPPPPQYPAYTILPLSLILLKREYRQ
jgi:hypothetical protein